MPTSRKARPIAKNETQPFQQTLHPALPLAPVLEDMPRISRRGAGIMLGVIIAALGLGILGGLALRNLTTTATLTATPGPVSVVTNPDYERITTGKAIAGSGTQTVQITQTTASVQAVDADYALQGAPDSNEFQPVLSAYDAQGSVGGPSR